MSLRLLAAMTKRVRRLHQSRRELFAFFDSAPRSPHYSLECTLWECQRCQLHKRRSVLDHITDENKPLIARKLNEAYAMEDYAAAKQALGGLHRELMHLNPSAARSLAEGLEETLTVDRLHVPQQLRMKLASTNVIESAFSIVESVCRNVKRWHGGDQREQLDRFRPAPDGEPVPPRQRL